MTRKHFSVFFLAFLAIIGWNVFLIQRDEKLFNTYYRTQAAENYKKTPAAEIK